MKFKLIYKLGTLVFALILTAQSYGQTYCDATSQGAGNVYGGNVTAIQIYDDSGLIFGYNGIANNSSQLVLNPSAHFTLSSWEYFNLWLKGTADSTGNIWFTKVGIWADMNRDGAFSASECIADPVTGPYTHLQKDTWTEALLKLPGVVTAGKSRIRIRGCSNAISFTAANGCGSSGAYGNQVDMVIDLFEGPTGITSVDETAFSVYPNPGSGFIHYSIPAGASGELRITDINGRPVLFKEISSDSEKTLDIRNLANGNYVVTAKISGNNISRNLVILH